MRLILLLIALAWPLDANAQWRPAKCEVKPLWDSGDVQSANIGLMGTFEKDGREGESIHSFKLEGTPIVATVGIDYQSAYSKSKSKPSQIWLAIIVANEERKKIFLSVDSSEAKTRYRKGWSLSVTKNINFDDRIYMFTLSCWDASAFTHSPL
jgi:hypothetical protein